MVYGIGDLLVLLWLPILSLCGLALYARRVMGALPAIGLLLPMALGLLWILARREVRPPADLLED